MSALGAYVDGIAVLGPGLDGWPASAAVLRGASGYLPAPALLPSPLALPAAERRRTGKVVRLAIAIGLEASTAAGLDAATLPAVFSSSGGDGDNCHEICAALATGERLLSPTRFHNSVHNAPAGYWSIATGSREASTALCAYDASFAAGLLEALAQVATLARPVLLVACDTAYPPPLDAARPLAECFGAALVLAPARGPRSSARLSVALGDRPADVLADAELERLRRAIPAGRGLPLLQRLAQGEASAVTLEFLERRTLTAEIVPC